MNSFYMSLKNSEITFSKKDSVDSKKATGLLILKKFKKPMEASCWNYAVSSKNEKYN